MSNYLIYVPDSTSSPLQPAPGPYDHSVDERDHTVDQWKELIYSEVMEYEKLHGQNSLTSPAARSTPQPPTEDVVEDMVDGQRAAARR